MHSSAPNRRYSLRPAGSLVVLLAAMYAVCSDPASASRHLSSKYRAACKAAAEAHAAKFAAEPQQASPTGLWQLFTELLQTDRPEYAAASDVEFVAAAADSISRHLTDLAPLFQRPPPARG